MTITVTFQGVILTILAVLGMILLIYLILFFRKLIGTLKEVDGVLQDAKVVSGVAADQAQKVDGMVEGVGNVVSIVSDAFAGNQSILTACTSVVNAVSSIVGMKKTADNKEK